MATTPVDVEAVTRFAQACTECILHSRDDEAATRLTLACLYLGRLCDEVEELRAEAANEPERLDLAYARGVKRGEQPLTQEEQAARSED